MNRRRTAARVGRVVTLTAVIVGELVAGAAPSVARPLPDVFGGTVTLSGQFPASSQTNPDGSTFKSTAYGFTLTVSDLRFHGSAGAYDLTAGIPRMTPYTITSTAVDPTGCTTTQMTNYALAPGNLFGEIRMYGGLAGHQIYLSVPDTETTTYLPSSGCFPPSPGGTTVSHNAIGITSHHFSYRRASQTISIDETTSSPGLNNSTGTYTTTGQLTGCSSPRSGGAVVMRRDGKALKGGPVVVVAGEPIRLSAAGACSQAAEWRVQGATRNLATTSAVRDYLVENTGANSRSVVEYLNLPSLPKAFYFIKPGTYRVSARIGRRTASEDFIVREPDPERARIRTCTVALTNQALRGGAHPGASWVGPGWNSQCPPNGVDGVGTPLDTGHPGIEWEFNVRAASARAAGVDESGTLAMIQLISIDEPGAGPRCARVVNAADISAFYDSTNNPKRAYVKLNQGRDATWHDRDSPHLNLFAKTGTWYESFYARDYLMFKSEKPSSRWIALAATQWSWWARATRAQLFGSWTLLGKKDIGDPVAHRTAIPPQFVTGLDPANC